ncbi:cell wall hydrolase [Paenibacillus sp. NPDC058071]|uniref:cell wall hydrolase n=1 Tax=Paenibacillus sp. NPDC058071 TaxID=3346326 RepID=UPI0036DE9DAC
MKIRERLSLLGYEKESLKASLLAFQHDFHTHPLNTFQRLKQLTQGEVTLNLLARVIYSEAMGEPYLGKVAVGAVVLNRLASPNFPNTLVNVITEPLAFAVIGDGRFWLKPNRLAYRAARDALKGMDPTRGCLFFFNPDKATSKWIRRLKPKLRIGRHVFA